MTPAPVFDGAHLRAHLFPGTGDKLIVTFDFRDPGRSGFPAPNRSASFAARGFSQLAIKSAANDWFVNGDTLALEAALPAIVAPFRRVHLLGYSMGGFGALRFARALRATTAVLVSPQATIDPALAPWEHRYAAESDGFDSVTGDIRACASGRLGGFVMVDPFDAADLAHARLIRSLFPGLAVLRLGLAGHPANQVLAETPGGQEAIQRAAMSHRTNGRKVRALHRAGRATAPGYWQRLADRLAARHPEWAAAALARARALKAGRGETGPA